MILANYAQQNRNCVREWGIGFTNPLAQFKPPLFNNFYTPDTLLTGLDLSAFNNGYNSEYAWNLAVKTGGVGSTLNINGTGTLAATALAVKLAVASLSGLGSITAIGSLIIQAIASLSGSGGISDANLQAFLNAVANLSGSGGVTSANISALGNAVASILGTGSISANSSGIGAATADIVVTGTGLTTANVGAAVWSALASVNNVAGTMGEKLNDAGSAGNPWASLLTDNNTPGTFGYFVQNLPEEVRTEITTELTRLSELWALHGLDSANPVTATPTSRVTGAISQTITGDGTTNTTITRD